MIQSDERRHRPVPEIVEYYQRGEEIRRLLEDRGQLEFARTQELIGRYLPPPPAVILDIGGGAGVYALPLAKLGYEVHLIEPSPRLVEEAHTASAKQPDSPLASIVTGDARALDRAHESVDAILMFGPLYHLTEREDRLTALREAKRVLRPGGVVLAAGISRFASLLDGLVHRIDDPHFDEIVMRDLREGQHRNPTGEPYYFTTAFFHHPDEFKAEIKDAGLQLESILPVEGPVWLLQDFAERWADQRLRQRLLDSIKWIESEASLLGASAHMVAVAHRNAVERKQP